MSRIAFNGRLLQQSRDSGTCTFQSFAVNRNKYLVKVCLSLLANKNSRGHSCRRGRLQLLRAQVGRLVAMGASSSSPEAEVWPPDWNEMQEDKRKTAREAILSLSAMPPLEFLAIANAPYVIPAAVWRFDEYHAAAAAAVQEDIKLNKIIYKCVPKKLEESEFWRLYFSQVLYILDSVKVHGKFPPPPPPPPPVGKGGTTKGVAPALPPPPDGSSCILS